MTNPANASPSTPSATDKTFHSNPEKQMKPSTTIVALLMLLASLASAQDLRNGTLKTVAGDVHLVRGNVVGSAASGDGVQESDRIVTGRDAHTTFILKDGTILSAGPDTTVELAKIQFDTTTQDGNLIVNLIKGTLRVVTGWLGKLHPEQVHVTTPTSVVGVRGTDFIVEVP